ncbi:DNA repair protein XRCC2 homolog isoform X2 [Nicotiana sylvestris]|uniref:DNA repair protein XRCC2 homolog isoform X2 n=2 Tax=Nicotiana TaxID=4085 RepID=A0A1S4DNK0_TOBAC|nr:PREDICTED: DNA repair protein XRCC2 homolog isoform X2 [Nicotiana sylvestris]XP_016515002.1 PREDICTED: DNA repair protein XRCC2 homolog isoform X2 [Nicotiana tabacum]
MASARQWIEGDETAKQFLTRVLSERPFLPLPPPLHRIPLRAGNVVEIVGPSPSSKTRILIQAAINCILPKAWKGINYGGLERLVMFIDLDCRFDVLSLSQSLKQRIIKENGNDVGHKLNKVDDSPIGSKDVHAEYDEELFAVSMRRFLYIRCYDSFEFLATLKTMHFQLQKEKEAHGTGVYLLMIDSIGAFYWMDRASPSIPPGRINRKSLSLQSVSESVVQEIQKILLVHPMLVLTTKAASLQDKYTTREVRNTGQLSVESTLDSKNIRSSANVQLYREYMPSVWQSFVSHRMLVRPSDDSSKYQKQPIYSSEWLLPSLKISDKFTFNDDGAYIIS